MVDVPPRPDLTPGFPGTTPTIRHRAGRVSFVWKLIVAVGIAFAVWMCVIAALGVVGDGFLDESNQPGRGFVWNVDAVRLFDVLLPVVALVVGLVVAFWRGSRRARFPLMVSLALVLLMIIVLLFATGHWADCNVERCGWPT